MKVLREVPWLRRFWTVRSRSDSWRHVWGTSMERTSEWWSMDVFVSPCVSLCFLQVALGGLMPKMMTDLWCRGE